MNLRSHFDQISVQLLRYRDLWSPAPFKSLHPSWVEAYPNIQSFLLNLSDDDVARYAKDICSFAIDIQPIFPEATDLLTLSEMPALSRLLDTPRLSDTNKSDTNKSDTNESDTNESELDLRFFKTGIKQRKWEQIQAFEAHLPWSGRPLLEWCSGKGFLAQLYGLRHQQPVSCIEFNQQLCDAGLIHAKQYQVDASFHHHDVLQDNLSHLLLSNPSCVALHACGQLHISLIEHILKHKVEKLALAPCCYHLIPSDSYQALSSHATTTSLVLTKQEMRLALEEHVTGTQAELTKQQRLQRIRLAFDQFCRSYLQISDYTPTPALAQSWAKQSDEAILNHLANHHQMTFSADIAYLKGRAVPEERAVPQIIDWQPWIEQGHARFSNYQRYSLIRYLFRRLIEVWMVLDRGLALQEAGYAVNIGAFCEYSLTPRNLMIVAEKS